MIVYNLELEQFRGFINTTINFSPGFNLLVGENGAGKSSVLWALRVALSHIHNKYSPSKERPLYFSESDVANSTVTNWPYLNLSLEFSFSEDENRLWFSAQKSRNEFVDSKAGDVRKQTLETPDLYEFFKYDSKHQRTPVISLGKSKLETHHPLAVYYSAHRATLMEKQISKPGRTSGNEARAYAEALEDRAVDLYELANLWRKEAVLKEADGIPDRANAAIKNSLPIFLEGFSDLHLDESTKPPRLKVKKENISLYINQLSDGERSMLTILMDLTRRLALAYPEIADPALDASAVILIDELDLHLHPSWQRTIAEKLIRTFPKCQFIATTHSPQIVGEVPAENIYILEAGKSPYRPDQSLGMDSNWILSFLMGANPRNTNIELALNHISDLIEDGDYNQSQSEINSLRENNMSRDPELLKLQTRLDRFQILRDNDPEQ
jgi:predicted ATP-binding protein involved in virulence